MLTNKLTLFVALCAVFVTASGRLLQFSEDYRVEVDILGDGENAKISLTFAVFTSGYVTFGLGLTDSTTDYDLFIGGVHPNGSVYGKDYFVNSDGTHSEDTIQNWNVLDGQEIADATMLKVERLLDTKDADKDTIITNSSIFVHWSFGATDDVDQTITTSSRLLNLFTDDDKPATTTTTRSTTSNPTTTIPNPSSSTSSPTTTSVSPSGQPPIFRRLNFDANYTLDLAISGSGPNDKLQLLLKVNTIGYVGFGLSRVPNMRGGDLFIGGFDLTTNQTYGKDYYATGNSRPNEDRNSQDWEVISGDEYDGMTTLLVTRNLDTNDTTEDIAITDSDIYVLWSYGETDTIEYHGGTRGTRMVNLFTVDDSTPTTTPNLGSESTTSGSGATPTTTANPGSESTSSGSGATPTTTANPGSTSPGSDSGATSATVGASVVLLGIVTFVLRR